PTLLRRLDPCILAGTAAAGAARRGSDGSRRAADTALVEQSGTAERAVPEVRRNDADAGRRATAAGRAVSRAEDAPDRLLPAPREDDRPCLRCTDRAHSRAHPARRGAPRTVGPGDLRRARGH